MSKKQAISIARDITRRKRADGGLLEDPMQQANKAYNAQLLGTFGADVGQVSGANANKPPNGSAGSIGAPVGASPIMQAMVDNSSGPDGGGGGGGSNFGGSDSSGTAGGVNGSDYGGGSGAAPGNDGGSPVNLASGGAAFFGNDGDTTTKVHVGPIHSPVAGRTDHLPMHVPSGSYVIPADIISAMGEGNTMAGFKVANTIFSRIPGLSGAPGEQAVPTKGSMPGMDAQLGLPGKARGGAMEEAVPIVAAGGEYVISPDDVRRIGEGDMDRGHQELDLFVKAMRAKTIKTLKSLPGPKKD